MSGLFWTLVIVILALGLLAGCTMTPQVDPQTAAFLKLLNTPKAKPTTQPLHRRRPGEYPTYNVQLLGRERWQGDN